jgi:hypothetical protein
LRHPHRRDPARLCAVAHLAWGADAAAIADLTGCLSPSSRTWPPLVADVVQNEGR